jgi:hypothetical protein
MLIVNGSAAMRKWKLLGSIDEIMDEYHRPLNNVSNESRDTQEVLKSGHSRIPAHCSLDIKGAALPGIVCMRTDLNSVQKSSSEDAFHADCSLHYYEGSMPRMKMDLDDKTSARPIGSNSSCQKTIKIVSENKFTETNEWLPFQPGCTFEIEWHKASPTDEIDDVTDDIRCTVAKHQHMPNIKMNIADKPVAGAPCYMHIQCFEALQQKVEAMCAADECETTSTEATLYSHQLLDAYKPKGKNAMYSVLIHNIFCTLTICPTLAFFTIWGFNAVETYAIHPFHTPAAYFVIVALIYMAMCFLHFLLIYLDFPYLFYGQSMFSSNASYFCFKPFTGAWCVEF